MACDLVATMLFVFCHVVSTIEVKTGNGTASDAASEDSQSEKSDHRTVAHGNHMDTPKLIPEPYGSVIEGMCVLWIMFHYFAGLAVAEEKFKYVKSFMSMVDAIIVVAVLIDSLLHWNNISTNRDNLPLRAIGVLRLFNLARHSTLLYCLGLALRQSFSDLLHVVGVIIFIMFLAAGFVYFAEQPPCGKYDRATNSCLYNDSWIGTDECKFHRECTSNQTKYVSIFASSYWAAVTITTVGYGDMIPTTTFGKIVGSILALIGLPLIAIPMPLIMTKFEKLYTTVKEQQSEEHKNQSKGSEQHKNNNCYNKTHNNNCNDRGNLHEDGDDNRDTSKTSSYDSLADETTVINVMQERPQDAMLRDYSCIKENGGEVKDSGNIHVASRTWAQSYKNAYGRCPTGDCAEMDCRMCSMDNTSPDFSPQIWARDPTTSHTSPTESDKNGRMSN